MGIPRFPNATQHVWPKPPAPPPVVDYDSVATPIVETAFAMRLDVSLAVADDVEETESPSEYMEDHPATVVLGDHDDDPATPHQVAVLAPVERYYPRDLATVPRFPAPDRPPPSRSVAPSKIPRFTFEAGHRAEHSHRLDTALEELDAAVTQDQDWPRTDTALAVEDLSGLTDYGHSWHVDATAAALELYYESINGSEALDAML